MRRRIIRLGRQQPVEQFEGGPWIAPPGNKRTEIMQYARMTRVQFQRRAICALRLLRAALLLISDRLCDQNLKIVGTLSHVRPADS